MSHPKLVQYFVDHFHGGGHFSTIVEARRHAEQVLGEKVVLGTALTKQIDESIEAALVRVARTLIATSITTHQAYNRLLDLYTRQPTLGVRSSTSVLQQAYSTPLPIAYLASALAGITSSTTVYEPTGGHGALLIAADPAQVTVNEINMERVLELRSQGFNVTRYNALDYAPLNQFDRVICNPPFGVIRDSQNQAQRFEIPGSQQRTTQIDHAIALKALTVMKNDGRSVLILGGKLGDNEDDRANRYNTLETRNFYAALYEQYNVIQHVSIQGALYRKQGSGFPIDLIVIAGRGRSHLKLPAAQVPPIFKSGSISLLY
jgi:hypothetical protein